MKKIAQALIVLLMSAALLVPASSASALTWKYSSKNGCFEYFKSGQHTAIKSVCKNVGGSVLGKPTARAIRASIGGVTHYYCLPYNQLLYLGVPGEWKVVSHNPPVAMCDASHAGGKVYFF